MFLDEFVYRLFPWRLEKLSQENLCFDNDYFFFFFSGDLTIFISVLVPKQRNMSVCLFKSVR